MKKTFRKISALLMTIVMVLSMCTAVFAATDSAIITVNGADGATLKYAQVIVADTTTKTGWNFVGGEDGDIAAAYKAAFPELANGQAILEAMTQTNAAGDFTVNAEQLGLAQAKAAAVLEALGENGFKTMTNEQTVTAPGVYLVKATKAGWTYNIMAAYVGFNKVTIDENGNYKYSDLQNAEITAKKSPITVTKTVSDADNVTHTGDILTYTVTANVPYIEPTDTNKTFFVYDNLTGAEYYTDATHPMTITNEGEAISNTINAADDKMSFSVDLSNLINDANSNAGNTIVITYSVKVTSANDKITNTATAGHEGGDQYGSDSVTTYEGNITLTKTNVPKDGEEAIPLAGAKFEVRKDDGEEDALTFVEIKDADDNVIEYKYDPAGTVTKVVTKADGTVKVRGLDAGTYIFKEVEAPDGYSINTTDVTATLTITEADKEGKAAAVLTQTTSMQDTKLGSLPSTGGIGTYIFTIAGVVLMACAAGAFFISRKKSEE